MRLTRLVRTSSFRLTLFYAGLFCASAMLLLGLVALTATTFLTRQIDNTVTDEVTEVQADVAGLDMAATRDVVVSLTQRAPGMYYLLEDGGMRVLAGNLQAIPPEPGLRQLASSSARGSRRLGGIRGKGVWLANGAYLFVGRSDFELRELSEAIARAAVAGLAATLILAVLGGIATSLTLLRRIDGVSRISRDIMAGDLGRRIPLRGTDDEFDHLAGSLNAMLDRIQELMSGLQQVSSDIAHDLRTPLTRLRQRLELAGHRENSVDGLQNALRRSIADVDAILDTFGALLRIAQVDAGTRRAGFKALDLGVLLSDIAEVYQPVADEKSQALASHVAGPLVIVGDRDLLMQLFSNLVENAIHYSPVGAAIQVGAERANGDIVAVVADNGPGIPADHRKDVLRRFYRLEGSRGTAGSGLGLSLAQAVATLHDTTLELADNHPGLRCTLRFRASSQLLGPAGRGPDERAIDG